MRGNKGVAVMITGVLLLSMIGTIGAYYIGQDDLLNEFTVGDVAIELTEPLYSRLDEEDKSLLPSDDIVKDPKVTNIGEEDAYVFIKLEMPMGEVCTADVSTGHRESIATRELFEFIAGTDWKIISRDVDYDNKKQTYIYAYTKGADDLAVLAPGAETSVVFAGLSTLSGKPGIHLVNVLEDSIDVAQALKIPVTAYAIQANDLGEENSDDPVSVWRFISNQRQ